MTDEVTRRRSERAGTAMPPVGKYVETVTIEDVGPVMAEIAEEKGYPAPSEPGTAPVHVMGRVWLDDQYEPDLFNLALGFSVTGSSHDGTLIRLWARADKVDLPPALDVDEAYPSDLPRINGRSVMTPLSQDRKTNDPIAGGSLFWRTVRLPWCVQPEPDPHASGGHYDQVHDYVECVFLVREVRVVQSRDG